MKWRGRLSGLPKNETTSPDRDVIQSPELVRSLQQSLGLRTRSVAPTYLPQLMPVIVVDDLTTSRQRAPIGYSIGQTATGDGAGQSGGWRWRNPASSGRSCRLRRIYLTSDGGFTGLTFFISPIGPDAAPAVVTSGPANGRRLARGAQTDPAQSALLSPVVAYASRQGSLTADPALFISLEHVAGAGGFFRDFDSAGWLLGPGASFDFTCQGNATLNPNLTIEWDELPA